MHNILRLRLLNCLPRCEAESLYLALNVLSRELRIALFFLDLEESTPSGGVILIVSGELDFRLFDSGPLFLISSRIQLVWEYEASSSFLSDPYKRIIKTLPIDAMDRWIEYLVIANDVSTFE